MDSPEYILNEINKGIKMGMDSLSTISEKVGDQTFKDDLLFEYNKYNDILNKVNSELNNRNVMPNEINPAQKAMGWVDIQASTITDKSNSHLSEMLIKGTNMGIIEGVKLLNRNPETDDNIKNILNEFIKFQENNVEKFKKYL